MMGFFLEAFIPGVLLTIALLQPLLGSSLRAPVDTTVLATDASGGSGPRLGACTTLQVSEGVAREAWRHRRRRGG